MSRCPAGQKAILFCVHFPRTAPRKLGPLSDDTRTSSSFSSRFLKEACAGHKRGNESVPERNGRLDRSVAGHGPPDRRAALADWHAGQEPREERGLDDRAMRRGQRVKWLWKLTMGENIPERDKNGQKKGVAYGTVFYPDRSIVTVSPRLCSFDAFV